VVVSLNEQVARQLALMGELLAVKGDRFRSNAYLRAAQSVRSLGEDIAEIAERGGLEEIPGVGRSIAMNIAEIIETGGLTALEELKASLPKGVLEFMELEGVGPKLAMRLAKELEVSTIDEKPQGEGAQRLRPQEGGEHPQGHRGLPGQGHPLPPGGGAAHSSGPPHSPPRLPPGPEGRGGWER